MVAKCAHTGIDVGVKMEISKFDRTKAHEKLVKQCLLELTTAGYLAWKVNTGVIKTDTRYQVYGLKGGSDIMGISPDGQFIGCECKTGKAVQNKAQKAFQKAVEKRDGIYIIIRSLEEIKEFLR